MQTLLQRSPPDTLPAAANDTAAHDAGIALVIAAGQATATMREALDGLWAALGPAARTMPPASRARIAHALERVEAVAAAFTRVLDQDAIVKRCSCGQSYTAAEVERLELRQCRCASTIARVVEGAP
jgi:hypothetical protein